MQSLFLQAQKTNGGSTLSMWDKVAEFSRIYSYIYILWESTERMHKESNKPFSEHDIIADRKCERMF